MEDHYIKEIHDKKEIPASVSDEVGYSDPQSKPNEEEKQMYPSLKPPKIKVQPKPEKHNNTGIALNTTNYDEDLRKPPFRFPLKEYTQEILQQNVQNNRTKVPKFRTFRFHIIFFLFWSDFSFLNMHFENIFCISK